jgi:hypothetical protein
MMKREILKTKDILEGRSAIIEKGKLVETTKSLHSKFNLQYINIKQS